MRGQTDPRAALRALVDERRNQEWPAGDWITPLETVMNNGRLFSALVQRCPFPMAVYDRNGEVQLANDTLLEETGLRDEDVKSGVVNIMGSSYIELMDALLMAFHGKTTVVNGLRYPLDTFVRSGSPASPRGYKAAIVFPCVESGPVLRGVALFLPFEL